MVGKFSCVFQDWNDTGYESIWDGENLYSFPTLCNSSIHHSWYLYKAITLC